LEIEVVESLPVRVQQKQPSPSGQVLLAWDEGTGGQKGGSLAWQLFDAAGKPSAEGHAPGVPVWGLSSVFADRQGNFTIVY
jgi:hypothetical protein